MKTVERLLTGLMLLGGIGHSLGSYRAYSQDPMTLLWALSFSFAVFLLAGVNLLRVDRPEDRGLAWLCLAGCLVQMGFALSFGRLIGNQLDFRPLVNCIVAVSLAIFSLRCALRPAAEKAAIS